MNYYNNEEVTIPLDPTMTPAENSKKYFDKYGKLKRTEEALKEQLEETRSEIDHLESISNALDIALAESDLARSRRSWQNAAISRSIMTGRKVRKCRPNPGLSTMLQRMAMIFM